VGDHKGFTFVLRGYDPLAVDAMLDRLRTALASTDPAVRASMRAELAAPEFPRRVRGYDRAEVDEYLRRAIDRLA
jgi:DivIVA domain-containing protein